MAPSIHVCVTRIEVLYQHFIRLVVRSDYQLSKRYRRCASGKYYYLIISVYETTDHCLISNVYDVLSAAQHIVNVGYKAMICGFINGNYQVIVFTTGTAAITFA